MTLTETAIEFAMLARSKSDSLRRNPLGFLIAAMMAGAYIGIGVLLIFSVGETVDPSVRNLVMGCSFGIALTLVIFAGSELFTGHAMFMTLGRLSGTVSLSGLARCWIAAWFGNLVGCIVLALLFVAGGGGTILQDGADLLNAVAARKMNAPAGELVARAILCNWLVCLAIWTSARTTNDAAKCVLIFWCLFAFIAAGFEHSVANMTIFAVALLSDHPDSVTVSGAAWNLLWVTVGNAISGAGIMGFGYWLVCGRPRVDLEGNPVSK
ncbi:MAG: formate/nitrite transporter family protein [Proteobacteria bacterium]|nr:formate/nitrite transporter family protein [Pseudomonadota bacterium]MDA1357216.1 formate/nitrite transporter family protein [Pseudomonadota bacterium]